ncbi:MAG: nitronate monooxygenase [Nevskiaceae bacterium]|nr:MAG: nitronate monooxygenase [Nevskiaceae bacterium]TBR73723.1 MAG: nitronate monooxygenase [Nevskiaceae bacterium]
MITTRLTELLGLEQPLILGPMAAVAGGRLAAAVSNAGGLGLVGGGYGRMDWLQRELSLVRSSTQRPWGIGLITWSIDRDKLDAALASNPDVVFLSFGDPRPHAARIKAKSCKLICQVQDVAGALLAKAAGADAIVAQGTEGGGHGGQRATLPLIPAVVDAVDPIPVVAAGGIADGRGLAAALMLGAQGALLGTRFYCTTEALGDEGAKQRIVEARGDHTRRTRVFDAARGYHWPDGYTGRALHNAFMDRWEGHEQDLAASTVARDAFRAAVAVRDYDTAMVWAGECVDLIHSVETTAAVVTRISREAEAILRTASTHVSGT